MAIVHSTLLLVVLLVGPATGESPLDTVNVGQIAENLGMYFEELSDEVLGVEAAQNEYASLTANETRFSIDNLITALSLDAVVEEIRNISDRVFEAVQSSSNIAMDTELGECCRSATSEPCCHRCSEYSMLDTESLNAGFSLSQEAGNAEEPVASASFQFGFESGPLVQYPPPSVGCSVTDARLQQWYTFAVSQPRTVAVLLDVSFDLSRADRNALLNAAVNLLQSLNSKDQVSVVVYSDDIQTPPSCYKFISATAENIDYLVNSVRSAEDLQAPANIRSVLAGAVANLNGTDLSGRKGMVAIFSGTSVDFNSTVAMVTGNPHIEFRFILPQETTSPLPPELSHQNSKSNFLSQDTFQPIASFIDQRNTSTNQLEWTTSLDPSTGGKFISFVRPLSMGNSLLGVFHARIAVTELFRAAFRYFDTKPLSYFFITDSSNERRAVYHPLSQGNNIIQSIFEVESSLMMVNNINVLEAETLPSINVFPLGPSDEDGLQIDTQDYFYSCRPALSIDGFSNQLVLCVALRSANDVDASLRSPTASLTNLAYHTQLSQETACSHLAHQANRDAALRLYGASQPAVGVSDPALHTYLTTGGAVPEGVMQGVRADSSVVSTLTRTWTTNTFAQITTWRYFLSNRGLFAVFPGIQLPANYLPAESTWYRSALPQANIALSPVERDPLGSGFVYGVSRRVLASSVAHGVVGAHLSAGSLVAKVEEFAPECRRDENMCFIFDTSGSIIYFRGLRSDPPTSVLSLTEVNSQDQFLSHVLNDATQFKRREICIDYSRRDLSDRHFYQYTWPAEEVNNTALTSACLHYRIRGIPGTNAIFAISARPGSQQCSPLCPCTNTCPASQCPNYAAVSSPTCSCRCSCAQTEGSVCQKKDQDLPICPPLREQTAKFRPVTEDFTSAACTSTQSCTSLESDDTCLSASSCLLCGSTCQGFQSCCNTTNYTNGFGTCDTTMSTTQPPAPTNPINIAAIVVPVIIILVLIVLIFVALMVWYNCRIKGKEEPGKRKHRGAFDFSKDKSLGVDDNDGKTTEVSVDSDASKEKKNLAVAAPAELGNSTENGEKAVITDTPV